MKKLIYLLLLISSLFTEVKAQDQAPVSPTAVSPNFTWYKKIVGSDTLYYGYSNSFWTEFARNKWVQKYYVAKSDSNTTTGYATINYANNASPKVPGGPFTSLPTLGFNPGTNITPSAVIIAAYYQSQPPTSGLIDQATSSNNVVQEFIASGARLSTILVYSAGRQSATALLALSSSSPPGIFISGGGSTNSPGFSQPSQGGSPVTGTVTFSYTRNTTTVFTNTVTTIASDNKSASSTVVYSFASRIYYGRSTSSTPSQSDILAFLGGGNPLNANRLGNWTVNASGSNHPFIAVDALLPVFTLIKDSNGFDVTSSFPMTVVSVTNSGGDVRNFNVYTFVTATSSNYTFTTVN